MKAPKFWAVFLTILKYLISFQVALVDYHFNQLQLHINRTINEITQKIKLFSILEIFYV